MNEEEPFNLDKSQVRSRKAEWRGRMRSDFGRLSHNIRQRVLSFILQVAGNH